MPIASETERQTITRHIREGEEMMALQIDLLGRLIANHLPHDSVLETLQLYRSEVEALRYQLERCRGARGK